METIEHIIREHEVNQRIDKVIADLNDDWSRTQVQQWIKEGHVLVNGEKTKANYKACLNDVVEINIPEPEILDVEPEEMDLDMKTGTS